MQRIYKTRREMRRRRLLKLGFLPFEARQLSKISWGAIPWFKAMLRERYEEYKEWMADESKGGHTYWQVNIIQRYKDNSWVKKDRLGRRLGDAMRMMHKVEDKFRAKFPNYESPWEKKQRDFKDYQKKLERTIAKLRGEL